MKTAKTIFHIEKTRTGFSAKCTPFAFMVCPVISTLKVTGICPDMWEITISQDAINKGNLIFIE
jgi:hypothetical protein